LCVNVLKSKAPVKPKTSRIRRLEIHFTGYSLSTIVPGSLENLLVEFTSQAKTASALCQDNAIDIEVILEARFKKNIVFAVVVLPRIHRNEKTDTSARIVFCNKSQRRQVQQFFHVQGCGHRNCRIAGIVDLHQKVNVVGCRVTKHSHALIVPGSQTSAVLPPQGSRCAFEWPLHRAGNPAPIKIAVLRCDNLAIDGALVNPPRVKRDVPDEVLIPRAWRGVPPHRPAEPCGTNNKVCIGRNTFEFTPCCPLYRVQHAPIDIRSGQVVVRWV
jgi:hypothetical protein